MAMDTHDADDTQARLVAMLRTSAMFGGDVPRTELLETHISRVLLTGTHAYKIKKPVDLGFVDFTTLEARRRYCEAELRLNRRLAPALYLGVVAITGTPEHPVIGDDGPVLEYAVKMREFPQDALASRELARGRLTMAHIDELATKIAAFHARIDVASADGPFAGSAEILGAALDNFAQIRALMENAEQTTALDALRDWTEREHAALAPLFGRRRRDGFVRECHGDLHLGNIAIVEGKVTVFDCIEFNDRLRWIDVMSEVAFAVMDLQDRKRPDLAYRFLNAWLEITGDYAGLAVLRFYLVYRAMVRAKVTRLRAAQLGTADAQTALLGEFRAYLELARFYAIPPRPAILITHGLSGSGKTTLSQRLLQRAGAIRIRTDVERKRVRGLAATARSGSVVGGGIYTADATEAVYRRALTLARAVATAGYVAIVDGTFLERRQRDLFRALGEELDVPFLMVTFDAAEETLRERVARRGERATDASEANLAVLRRQLQVQEPLAPEERAAAIVFDAGTPPDRVEQAPAWRMLLGRLGIGDAT